MARKILRNEQRKRIKDLLPDKAGDKGTIASDNRLFIEAALWLLRTGAPWCDFPPEFGRWHTAYMRFARWHVNRAQALQPKGLGHRTHWLRARFAGFRRIA